MQFVVFYQANTSNKAHQILKLFEVSGGKQA
jgi:hypothetical protein